MTKTTALASRFDTLELVPMRDFEAGAIASIQTLITTIGSGQLSRRQTERLRRATDTLSDVVGDIERVVTHGENIARASATLARDVEELAAEIDEFQTKRAENAVRRVEAAERAKHVGEAARQELRVRTLTATVQAEDLQAQLDARRAARAQAEERAAQERITIQQRTDRTRATRDARAAVLREKHEHEATRIVQDVQIGAVPADAAHPYHAYAACVYLAARVDDGLTTDAAISRTRDAVLRLMLGVEVAPETIARYHEAYVELKARATSAARHRDTTDLFAAAEAFAGGVQ